MKYKVIANNVVMIENCSCSKALNMVCGIMQGLDVMTRVSIYYLAGNETTGTCWKLENSFQVEPK